MSTLLVLDTSPRQDAVSRHLTQKFVSDWTIANPNGTVLHHDIGANPPAHLDDELIDALRRNPEALNQHQTDVIKASDAVIADLAQADMIVIGAPMHNFTMTGAFRTWIDHVARPGKTFGYSASGPEGLLNDKPVYVLSTRGGQYGDGDPENPHSADFQSDYLRHIFGFMGIQSLNIIAANGMDMGEEPRAAGIEHAKQAINAVFAA
ncbi:MAG: NAD(P)H-dependent oxidoreductase [Pseudomonadota bacterium]